MVAAKMPEAGNFSLQPPVAPRATTTTMHPFYRESTEKLMSLCGDFVLMDRSSHCLLSHHKTATFLALSAPKRGRVSRKLRRIADVQLIREADGPAIAAPHDRSQRSLL